jgi:hypothetical protein
LLQALVFGRGLVLAGLLVVLLGYSVSRVLWLGCCLPLLRFQQASQGVLVLVFSFECLF